NQAQWARLYLARGEILDSSARGIWTLTETGAQIDPKTYDFRRLFKEVQKKFQAESKKKKDKEEDEIDDVDESTEDYRVGVLRVLRSLPPAGFERLCQRLLRESGFEQVVVTGRSGDGG